MRSAELTVHSVLGRAFGLLDAFADSPAGLSAKGGEFSLSPELSLTELAQRSGVPKGSLHRLLGQLVALDVVERTGNRYRLSLHMIELAGLSPWLSQLRETVLPYLIELHEATHQTIHLGVLRDTDVVYVERIRGHASLNCPTRVGGRMPAYCTGLGKSLLAFADERATSQVLATGLKRRTPYTIVAPGLLLRDLDRVASEGAAFDREEAVLGLVCVAAPVLVGKNPVAAISISGRASEIQRPRLSHLVKDTAQKAGRALEPLSRAN
jgi:IclR family transcriptional regulator, acetate operon repressor